MGITGPLLDALIWCYLGKLREPVMGGGVEGGGVGPRDILELGGMGIRRLPSSLYSQTILTSISLPNNLLTILPPEVGQLTQLRFLDVRNNLLEDIPTTLGKIATLETLLIEGNPLKELPDEDLLPRTSEDVLNFLRHPGRGMVEWGRVRVGVLGEKGVGKSSLVWRLMGGKGEEKRKLSSFHPKSEVFLLFFF